MKHLFTIGFLFFTACAQIFAASPKYFVPFCNGNSSVTITSQSYDPVSMVYTAILQICAECGAGAGATQTLGFTTSSGFQFTNITTPVGQNGTAPINTPNFATPQTAPSFLFSSSAFFASAATVGCTGGLYCNSVTISVKRTSGTGSPVPATVFVSSFGAAGPSAAQCGTVSAQRSITPDQALPIHLVGVDAKPNNSSVSVTWTTATEANNSYFAIERSANGKDFQTIGTVRGAGMSATEKNYQFTDATPLRGINYYRLKQMDFDGRSEYSEIKAVKMSSGGLVSLRPTEASEQLVITLQEAQIGNSELAIFDQLGRVIYRTNIAEGSLEALVNVGNFNAGAYFVRVGTGSESSVLRFIKIKD